RRDGGALPVSRAGHHQPVHCLQAPTLTDELLGEPVEQFRVRGRHAGLSEVAQRFDDAVSEMMFPQPIYRDAGGQRMVRTRQPLSERELAAGFLRAGPWRLYFERRLTVGER